MHALNFLVAVQILLLYSCAQDKPKYTDKGDALETVTKELFIPLAIRSQGLAVDLQRASETFCATPDETTYADVRASLQEMQLHWKTLEVMSFGPHRLFPWRTESRVDFWPARPDNITDTLQDVSIDLSADAAAAGLGASGTGLPVASFLLHGPNSSLKDFLATPRRCQYLVAITRDVTREIEDYARAWQGEYQNALLYPTTAERYENDTEAFGEMVNNVTFTVELIREKKLGAPLGMKSGELDPRLCEMPFAGSSVAAAVASLEGVHRIMTGCLSGHGGRLEVCGFGLRMLIEERNPKLATSYDEHFSEAYEALSRIQGPLTLAVVERPEQVTAAIDALRELVVFFHVEMTQALNVTVTFGGTDGD